MGAIWLLSMPDVLRNAGLNVDVYPGWQTRGRSTGGYDALYGVQVHQTVSNTTPANDMAYMWQNASAKPIGAIHLARTGKLVVGAAGATNTSGKGGPLGPIPQDAANRYVISIEAANDGYGEPWTPEQQRVYPIACNALVNEYDLDFAVPGLHAHFEWSPGRKVDPRGPSRWATGLNLWDMNKFRADARAVSALPPSITIQGVKDMFFPLTPSRMADTRVWPKTPLNANQVYEFGLNPAVVPANAVAVCINVTAIGGDPGSWLTIWDKGPNPGTSVLNFVNSGIVNTTYIGPVSNLKYKLQATSPMHIVCDVTGYWTP